MKQRDEINAELRSMLALIDQSLIGLYAMFRELTALDCEAARVIRRRAREFLSTFPAKLDRIHRWASMEFDWPSEECTAALRESRETVEGLRAILREFENFKNREPDR